MKIINADEAIGYILDDCGIVWYYDQKRHNWYRADPGDSLKETREALKEAEMITLDELN